MNKMEQRRKGGGGDDSVRLEKKKKTDKEAVSQEEDACETRKKRKKNQDEGDCAGPSNQTETEGNVVDDWKAFKYRSEPSNRNWPRGTVVYYYHWLRQDYTSLGKEEDYDDFDTLIHATSVCNAEKIFEYGELKQQVVKDSSITNPTIQFYTVDNNKAKKKMFKNVHPMLRTEVVWYGPYKRDNLKTSEPEIKRYGNAVFSMKTLFGFEGIIRKSDDFNYYFVEIVDYLEESACRILITKKEYPQLLKYCPYDKGGPWYIDRNGRHKHLTKIKNARGRSVPNTLEFMREEEEPFRYMWLANHNISYKPCFWEKKGVSVTIGNHPITYGKLQKKYIAVSSNDNDRLKLALGLLAYKMKSGNKSVVQQWEFLEGDKSILDTLNYIVKPLMETYTKKNHLNNMAIVSYDGPHAVEISWLESQYKDRIGDDFECHSLYQLLKEQIDMSVFDITDFIRCLLIYHRNNFFVVNKRIEWVDLFLTNIYPQYRSIFFKTLSDIIQKNLFSICSGNDSQFKEMSEMSVGQNHFGLLHFESASTSENREPVIKQHWPPNDRTDFGSDFEEFDTLTYSTSLRNAYKIFEEGKLIPFVLCDNFTGIRKCSEILQQQKHPFTKLRMMLYQPDSYDKMTKGYFSDHCNGNVVFAMKTLEGLEGIVERKGDEKIVLREEEERIDGKGAEGDDGRKSIENFHYYFIDVLENEDTGICRILVTQRPIPQLCPYDPNLELGPWYVKNNKHYHSLKMKNLKGEQITCKVEFYREEHVSESLSTRWLTNHEILYKPDRNQGKGDGELKLALGLLGCKIAHSDNLVLQQWFLLGGTNAIYEVLKNMHEHMQEELSKCGEETDECFPDHLSKQIAQLMQFDHFGQNGEDIFSLYSELSKQMDFRNMDMTSFVQGILKFYRSHFFSEEVELTTVYKKLLSLVSPDRLSLFLDELKWALQHQALHRIHRKTLTRNWTGFSCYIKHAVIGRSGGSYYVLHWLPRDLQDLLPEDYSASNRDCFYKKFDVLMKSPGEKNYERDNNGRLKPKLHRIDGPSVANKENLLYDSSFRRIGVLYSHPLNDAEIYCYMADTMDSVKNESERKKKYGDNTFRMTRLWGSESIVREKNDFKYYLVEVMDFPEESICRILATYRNIPYLMKIDAEIEGGPIIRETLEYLCMVRNSKGIKVKNRIEFLKEVAYTRWQDQKELWISNHTESYPADD